MKKDLSSVEQTSHQQQNQYESFNPNQQMEQNTPELNEDDEFDGLV